MSSWAPGLCAKSVKQHPSQSRHHQRRHRMPRIHRQDRKEKHKILRRLLIHNK